MEEIKKAYLTVPAAQEALEKDAEDVAAAATVGRFLVLYKGDFEHGMPLLFKGADTRMKEVAKLEKAKPEEGADKRKIGDAWMTLAEKETNATAKKNAWKRAKHWYGQAVESLTGTAKTSTEKELKKLDKLLPSNEEDTAEKPSGGGDFDRKLAQARTAMRQVRFDQAVEILTSLIGQGPDEKAERSLKKMLDYAKAMQEGISQLGQSHFGAAARAFGTALEIYPGDQAAQYGMNLAQQAGKGAGNGGKFNPQQMRKKGRG